MAKQATSDKQKQKRQHWKGHIEEWSRIGITQAEYCRQHKLSAKSFTYWKRKFREKSSVSFVPVQVRPEPRIVVNNSPELVVHKDGYRIEIKEGFKPAVLGEVLRTIREVQC